MKNRKVTREEVRLVNRGIEFEMREIAEGRVKTEVLERLRKKYER